MDIILFLLIFVVILQEENRKTRDNKTGRTFFFIISPSIYKCDADMLMIHSIIKRSIVYNNIGCVYVTVGKKIPKENLLLNSKNANCFELIITLKSLVFINY